MAEMVETILNGKYRIILPKHRADREEWHIDEGWEKVRLESMHSFLRKDDVMFYVGAEEGDMAALCQMWGCKMVLFEPNDLVWPNLKAIWEANKLLEPLLCFSGFASNKDAGNATVYSCAFPPNANGEVIRNHGFKELSDPGEIPQIKIDTLVEKTGIIPTAMSLDVEGSEFEVLRGAEQTLRKYKPKIWLSGHPEFLFRLYGEYLGDLRQWLKNIGYEETLLDYKHEVHLKYIAK